MLRFRGERASVALANFLASGIFNLHEKLGPILWQFPPSFKFDRVAFEAILQSLPAHTDEAASLAAKHDKQVKEACLSPGRKRRLRYAIEIRHPSFCDEAFIKLLRKYRAALVISDSVADWPYAEDMTSDFTYLRLHGTQTLYGTNTAMPLWNIGRFASENGRAVSSPRMCSEYHRSRPGGEPEGTSTAILIMTRKYRRHLTRAD